MILSVNASWFLHKYHFSFDNITMQQWACKTGLGDDQYIDVEFVTDMSHYCTERTQLSQQ